MLAASRRVTGLSMFDFQAGKGYPYPLFARTIKYRVGDELPWPV